MTNTQFSTPNQAQATPELDGPVELMTRVFMRRTAAEAYFAMVVQWAREQAENMKYGFRVDSFADWLMAIARRRAGCNGVDRAAVADAGSKVTALSPCSSCNGVDRAAVADAGGRE